MVLPTTSIKNEPVISELAITPVNSQDIEDVWFNVLPFVKQLFNRPYTNYIDETDILKALKKRDMQLWMISQKDVIAVVITEIIIYPKIKECNIVGIAGHDMKDWLDDVINIIKQWAKANDCQWVSGTGRDGWVKEGKHLGFEKAHVKVICEI